MRKYKNTMPSTMTPSEEDIQQETAQNAPVPAGDWQALLEQWNRAQPSSWLRSLRDVRPGQITAMGMVLMVAGMLLPLSLLNLGMDARFLLGTEATFLLTGIGLLTAGVRMERGLTAAQADIIAALGKVEDAQAVGPLLDLLDNTTTEAETLALRKVLTGLLPRVTGAHRGLLSIAQLGILYRALTGPLQSAHPDSTFVSAALEALANSGGKDALPLLARLTVRDAPTQGEQVTRQLAHQHLQRLVETLDFGPVKSVTAWVAKLPVFQESAESSAWLLPGGVSREQSLIAFFALTRLLPRLTPEHAGLLDAKARVRLVRSPRGLASMLWAAGNAALYDMRVSRLGSDYPLAVLEAMRQIGTGQEAEFVRKEAYGEALSEVDRRVRDRAREILPVLEARREKEQAGLTLLRGASAPPTAPNQLLRPAAGVGIDAANARTGELLRPRSDPQAEQSLDQQDSAGAFVKNRANTTKDREHAAPVFVRNSAGNAAEDNRGS